MAAPRTASTVFVLGLLSSIWGGLAAAAAIAAVILGAGALAGWLSLLAMSALLGLSGCLPGWLMARARLQRARLATMPAEQRTAAWGDDRPVLIAIDPVAALAGWPQALATMLPAGAALLLPVLLPLDQSGEGGELAAALIALAMIFPGIIAERWLHGLDNDCLPEGRALSRLLRTPVAVCVLAAFSLLAQSMGLVLAVMLLWPVLVLLLLIAVELVLRALIALWLPDPRQQICADSLVAGAILGWRNPLRVLVDGLRERWGVDLRASWSARFLGRSLLPTALLMVVLGWLATGVSTVPLGERAVLQQRSGARVLSAGTHLHAPWPWTSQQRLLDGRIHELALGRVETPPPPIRADDDPGPAYDRFWDVSHPGEAKFLVSAATTEGGQGFRIIAGDVRVHWRIGPEDRDAIQVVSVLADVDDMVARSARRVLVATFAGMPIETVFGVDRAAVAKAIKGRVQADLDALAGGHSGIDITALVVDALHPPIGAAQAYHHVQAAEIEARALVARARADAVRSRVAAEVAAQVQRTGAQAAASELAASARAEALRFDAERSAWQRFPSALAIERWFQAVRGGLSQATITVVDHRLEPTDGGMIDLRSRLPGDPRP